EYVAAGGDIAAPDRVSGCAQPDEELVGRALANAIPWHARQDHSIGRFVGAVRIVRVDVDETVTGAGVIRTEVDEARGAEAGREAPVGPAPAPPAIGGPGEL